MGEKTAILTSSNMLDVQTIVKNQLIVNGIYSDETESFLSPPEPKQGQPITFTIRTIKNNPDAVYLHINGSKHEMIKEKPHSNLFDTYTYKIALNDSALYYYSIVKNNETYYYNKQGTQPSLDHMYNFKVFPGFQSPQWAKGAVMYHIFVDRFYNGDLSNDVITKEYSYLGIMAKGEDNWEAPLTNQDFVTFYGGDLQGIIDKMSYLKNLGIDVIYLSPVFLSPSSHKYDIQDYDYIDPHFGVILKDGGKTVSPFEPDNKKATMHIKRTTDITNLEASNELFAKLVEHAHNAGIKVILDGVFNHCGAFHRWLNKEGIYKEKGAYESKSSPYVDYFKWYDDAWPNNIAYDGWWGHSNHPKLNFEQSQELYDYMLEVGKKWVSPPYNADGWRLDVAADLGQSQEFNHKFWRDFRRVVKEANPDAVILGEHYGDCQPWLSGDQWDTIMNYDAFMEPLTWFLTGVQKHSEEFKGDMLNNTAAFEGAMRHHMARMSYQSVYTSMNQLSNHDHSRFLTRTNMRTGRLHTVGAEGADMGIQKSILYEAVIFQMTWPGAPTLYYGDEAGLTGWTDPDNRRPYPWGKEDKSMISFHRAAIALHKNHTALKTGSLEYLHNEHGVISYGRWDKNEKLAVIINNNNHSVVINLPVWKMDIMDGSMSTLIYTANESFNLDKKSYWIIDGFMQVFMDSHSAMVLQ